MLSYTDTTAKTTCKVTTNGVINPPFRSTAAQLTHCILYTYTVGKYSETLCLCVVASSADSTNTFTTGSIIDEITGHD